MNTITMTFRQLRHACNSEYNSCKHNIRVKCSAENCPIWRRAERKAKNSVGRSGSPLTRKGKIVRLPKKRTCKNCGDKGCNMNGRFHTLSCKNGWKPRRG